MTHGNDCVITDLAQVTTGWLTAVLHRSGALTHGHVTACDIDTGAGSWSTNATLHLHYSANARGDCPSDLFLKLVDTNTGDGEYFLPAETTTYTRDYVDVPDAPLLPCYDAAYDPERHRYHVLLHDVSATHTDARHKTPTLGFGLALAEGFAAMHAHWWGAAQLATLGKTPHSTSHLRRFIAIAEPGIAHVKAKLTADLQPHWPALIDDIFAHLPDLLVARNADTRTLTLIHADPNPGNIMVPRQGERPIFIIDCQPFDWSLIHWLSAYDLAYAIALYWEPPRRRQLELPVLQHYHAQLTQRGVSGYSWQQFFDDYRLNVALCVVVAVEYMRGGGNMAYRDFIVTILRNALTAFNDHNCYQLWERP